VFLYLQSLIREKDEGGGYSEALDRVTVAKGRELVGKHKWLEEPLATWGDSFVLADVGGESTMQRPSKDAGVVRKKRVLMLGSGIVAGPAVDEICKRGDVELLVG